MCAPRRARTPCATAHHAHARGPRTPLGNRLQTQNEPSLPPRDAQAEPKLESGGGRRCPATRPRARPAQVVRRGTSARLGGSVAATGSSAVFKPAPPDPRFAPLLSRRALIASCLGTKSQKQVYARCSLRPPCLPRSSCACYVEVTPRLHLRCLVGRGPPSPRCV